MSTLPLVPLSEDRADAAWAALEEAFGSAPQPDDRDVELALVDPDRFLVALDGERVAATGGSFALRMALPGVGPVPVAGVTWVSVTATYRRQGLLGTLMERLLRERWEAGESVAALWATEAAIYQRYGYGLGSVGLTAEVPRGAAFARPVGRGGVQLVAPDAQRLDPVLRRVAELTPGWFLRDEALWAYRLHDPVSGRSGASPLRCLVTDDGDGYALYATTSTYGPGGPDGEVRVKELTAATPDAAARLWRFLLDLDLTTRTTARLASDDALLHLLAEPRRAVPRLGDALWVRPLDVGRALAARRYAADVDAVLDVEDVTCPWNTRRWRLSGGPDGAVCEPTGDPADLALTAADLGAALLGGTSLHARAGVGTVVEQRPGALVRVAAAFGPLGRAPHCPMVF